MTTPANGADRDTTWTIPETWQWAEVGAIGHVALGRQRSPINHQGPFMRPYLRSANITWAGLDLTDVKTMNFDAADFERFALKPGDVLLNEGSGSPREVGKPAIWSGEIEGCCFQNTLLRVQPVGCTPEFALAYFRFCALTGRFAPESQGVNIAHIGKDGLARFPIPLPPRAEQRRIVAKLDALTARTTRARADLDRVENLRSRYRLALLRKAMLGELTHGWRQEQRELEPASRMVKRTKSPLQGRGGREATSETIDGQAALSVNQPPRHIPPDWAWTPLLRIARQETGHTPSRGVDAYWNGGVPWIGIRDAGANHGTTITSTIQTISAEGLANSSARLLPKGTVCLSRTASVGYVTVMGREMATSQDFATWTCTTALDPKFLMYALMAEGDDIRAFGKGSTHTTIYFPEIRALHIALPPFAEQLEIVRRIDGGLANIDRLTAEAAAARRLLDRLDQAILAKAFRGELVPLDPADEPAAVLLARIKAERASAPAGARRGRKPKAA